MTLPDYYAEERKAKDAHASRNRKRWLCAIFAVDVAIGAFALGKKLARKR